MEARLEEFLEDGGNRAEGVRKGIVLESCCSLFNPDSVFHGGDMILTWDHSEHVWGCAAEETGCRSGIFWNIKVLEWVYNNADLALIAKVYAVAKIGDVLYVYVLKGELNRLTREEFERGMKRLEKRLLERLGMGFELVVTEHDSEAEARGELFRQHGHLKPMDEWVTEKAIKLLKLLI